MKTPLRTILLLLAVVTLFGLHAEVYKNLTFTLSDETVVAIPLSKTVKGEIQGENVIFNAGTNSYTVEAAKIKGVRFRNDLSSVVNSFESKNKPVVAGRTVYFNNLPAGSHIAVYTVDGRIVRTLDASGDAVLSLEDFQAGIYIVNVNKTTIKISLK